MSERCIEALVLAQREAEFLKSPQVGTAHALIGLLRGQNLGAQVLAELKVDVHIVRATLEKFRVHDDTFTVRRFSWHLWRAIDVAFDEARRAECPFVNTDHLYVGILTQEDTMAMRILLDLQTPIDQVLQRLRPRGRADAIDRGLAAELLDHLLVAKDAPDIEQVPPSAPGLPMSLDAFLEVLDELSSALQSAQKTVQAARPHMPVQLDIPEVAASDWPVVDEEAYQIAGLVRQILSQAGARRAERVVFLPAEGALRIEYHLAMGQRESVDIPSILRTVIPFKVMRMARLNPMEKGRELEGLLSLQLGGKVHDMRVRSEPIHKGLRVEVSLEFG